jgi:hypothetical protein
MRIRSLFIVGAIAAAVCCGAVVSFAQTPARPTLEQLRALVVNLNPEVRVAEVNHERLAVRRLDIVDDNGVIRLTLAASMPDPIVDGVQYRRAFPASGITIYDESGSERGGFGYAQIEGGAAVLAQDHRTGDAIGWRVMPDGAVSFLINQAPAEVREPALNNRLIPGVASPSRIRMNVAADGAPRIELADAQDRARIRLALTSEGYGALEFLDADGRVIDSIVPERARR